MKEKVRELQAEIHNRSGNGGKVRLMFQDEAGFGRINKPKYCWCEKGTRPVYLVTIFGSAVTPMEPWSL